MPQYDDVNERTMWSRTYRRLFRSVYPYDTWQSIERQSPLIGNATDHHVPIEFREIKSSQIGLGRQDSSSRTETQTSKRVSINDDEARSELSRKFSDLPYSPITKSRFYYDVDKMILVCLIQFYNAFLFYDDDVCTYVRDVLQREFPDGEGNLAVVDHDKHPIETVFNKTLKLTRNDKLRNHVRTSVRRRYDDDRAFICPYEEIVTPTSITVARSEFPRRKSYGSQRNEDVDYPNTNASSWSGPHQCIPLVTQTNRPQNSYRQSGDDVEKCDVHLLNSNDRCTLWNEEQILRRKIMRGELLNRGELLYLKKLHCIRVAEDEAELMSLVNSSKGEGEQHAKLLRIRLDATYKEYEDILETAQPAKTALLAHQILLGDAYLFHARILASNGEEQWRLYQRAIDIYRDLLRLARRTLSCADISLLTIAERIALILHESETMIPDLIVEITTILDEAEDRLRYEDSSESVRKIRQARQHLGAIGCSYYLTM
ncbi:hypothetical protein DICVIV_01226 [Dictyocaulus viviparus]|uniref:Uncharacterized protein n=1 Tax=Dictyocaulus viviparus TaxID=29172 RepID=A0A0D8YD42_DICVI|nr:hypothetical protein DICVIV_01226 [Dictyocaulus viviparus]